MRKLMMMLLVLALPMDAQTPVQSGRRSRTENSQQGYRPNCQQLRILIFQWEEGDARYRQAMRDFLARGQTGQQPDPPPPLAEGLREDEAKTCREEQRLSQEQGKKLEEAKAKDLKEQRELLRPLCENIPWDEGSDCDRFGIKPKDGVIKRFHDYCDYRSPNLGPAPEICSNLLPLPAQNSPSPRTAPRTGRRSGG